VELSHIQNISSLLTTNVLQTISASGNTFMVITERVANLKMFNWQKGLQRRVWRYQRGNQNPWIEEGQTTQWPKDKGQTTIYKALLTKFEIE